VSRRAKLDAIVTIVAGIILAFAAAALILGWAFSGWGDRPFATPSPSPPPSPVAWLTPA
jgi:hypothetical protein